MVKCNTINNIDINKQVATDKVVIELYKKFKNEMHNVNAIIKKSSIEKVVKNYYNLHILLVIQIILMKYIFKKNEIYKVDNLDDFIANKYKIEPMPLSTGFFGNIYDINKNKIVKIQKILIFDYLVLNEKEFKEEIYKEFNLLKKTSKYKFSPKPYKMYFIIVDSYIYKCIEMEKINGIELSRYLLTASKNDKIKIYNQVKEILNKLDKLKIMHNDLHYENILVEKSRNKPNIYIIDYGLSETHNKLNSKYIFDNNFFWKIRNKIKDYLIENYKIVTTPNEPLILYKK